MAELAVTDGMPPPSGLPDGEFIVHRVKDSIWIAHADPRILISAELLDLAPAFHAPQSDAWLDMTGCCTLQDRAAPYVGAVLHIDGINRQVVYRITDYVPGVHGYIGEWPD